MKLQGIYQLIGNFVKKIALVGNRQVESNLVSEPACYSEISRISDQA